LHKTHINAKPKKATQQKSYRHPNRLNLNSQGISKTKLFASNLLSAFGQPLTSDEIK